jgi:hypothetical protein
MDNGRGETGAFVSGGSGMGLGLPRNDRQAARTTCAALILILLEEFAFRNLGQQRPHPGRLHRHVWIIQRVVELRDFVSRMDAAVLLWRRLRG